MPTNIEKRYEASPLPSDEDVERFAIPYNKEEFSEEQQLYLSPFFTNLDRPAFVVINLPEEVKGALASRYSRNEGSLRGVFWREYLDPILHPENQKSWENLSIEEQDEAHQTQQLLTSWVNFFHETGGMDKVVNIQRGRAFFEKWLNDYGDDSIGELGGELVCMEGLSMVATKEVQDKRVGISPLEKSTRYVQYWEKRTDGNYQYVIPGELIGTAQEEVYTAMMDELFDLYSGIAEPYLNYIKSLYPKGEDESEGSFNRSRGAKRFDDIRDLLPFSTQTNVAMYGNGRAFEDLLTRLMAHPLGEMRWWGQSIHRELSKTVPSFVKRSITERGAQAQLYRTNIISVREELAQEVLGKEKPKGKAARWVEIVRSTPEADVVIISSFLYSANTDLTLAEITDVVRGMTDTERTGLLKRILDERKFGKDEPKREHDRFRKVPRAFENADFTFDMWGRGGDYRDLHRHRQLTQERQRFTTHWGYDTEQEVEDSEFATQIKAVLEKAVEVYDKIAKEASPDVAQYAVPFAFLQHWYMTMSAREIHWMVELRTGPQGRPHYRAICHDIARKAQDAAPSVFQGLMTDWEDYSLSRRESEKTKEKKQKALDNK